ncbi:MAG: hypothetical protein WBD27_12710 [Pyrinomonadaceae bacterium]
MKSLANFMNAIALTAALSPLVLGQLTEIKYTFPKSVPLEVKFKHYDKENWWHDLEIKVTNTGKKPIYFLDLGLWFDITNEKGNPYGITIGFGDVRRFFSTTNGEIAKEGDPAILPKESYTFRIGDNYVRGWDLRKKLGTFVEPRTAKLEHGFTNFGDGTGLEPGGTPWRTAKKNRNFEVLFGANTIEENLLVGSTIDFFTGSRQSGCAGRDERAKVFNFPKLLNLDFLMPQANCISCTPSNCPAPTGYESYPRWTKSSGQYQNCQNCNENPYRNVRWYDDGGGCHDETNRCYWLKERSIDCPTAGDPPQPWTCYEYQFLECQAAGCSSDPNADKDHDGYYVQTANCTPDPALIDCNDNPNSGENIHPGQPETSCFETPRVDEDCDNSFNCEDSDCRNVHGSACESQCDKDDDNHYSLACGGDDCVDDPALNAAAVYMYPGLNPNSGQPNYEWYCGNDSHWDEDCDGLFNCADPDCAQNPSCASTPTPTPTPDDGGGGCPCGDCVNGCGGCECNDCINGCEENCGWVTVEGQCYQTSVCTEEYDPYTNIYIVTCEYDDWCDPDQEVYVCW